jgi:hypothetical protein
MSDVGVLKHETVGASYLQSLGLNHKVAELVAGHVQAKRCECSLGDIRVLIDCIRQCHQERRSVL